jgi:hypothetical protein
VAVCVDSCFADCAKTEFFRGIALTHAFAGKKCAQSVSECPRELVFVPVGGHNNRLGRQFYLTYIHAVKYI